MTQSATVSNPQALQPAMASPLPFPTHLVKCPQQDYLNCLFSVSHLFYGGVAKRQKQANKQKALGRTMQEEEYAWKYILTLGFPGTTKM